MAARVGVCVIHGMGDPPESYAEGLIGKLTGALGEAAREVAFESCFWAPVLQQQQNVTWRKLQLFGRQRFTELRHWVVSALGDPVSYLSGYFIEGKPTYSDIHECLRATLERLARRLGDGGDERPLVILAHSLGTVTSGTGR